MPRPAKAALPARQRRIHRCELAVLDCALVPDQDALKERLIQKASLQRSAGQVGRVRRLCLGERSIKRALDIAGVHLRCVEQRLSLELLALEELALEADEVELISTAVVLDTLRWQPVFCWLAVCDLAVADLEVRMRGADHEEETGGGQIAALVPWTAADAVTGSLLAGTHSEMRLASNHAQAALLYALVYADGLEAVAEELGT